MALPSEPSDRRRARTLAEALKSLAPAELEQLLVLRRDLCYPLPADLTELSTRAGTTTSIGRVLESLDVWLRQTAEALAALPDPSSVVDVTELVGADPEPTVAAVDALRRRALLWGDDDALHLVRGVREYFDPYPGGLAPPSSRPLSPEQIRAALAECDDAAHALLDRLRWSPTGAVRNADRRVDLAAARSPVDQLLARQLLRPLDPDTVILPREVSLHLRSGQFFSPPVSPEPPPVTGRPREGALVDKAAAGAAFGLLHDIELAAHSLEETPHRLLRTGGLAARDLAALGRNLSSDPGHASFVMECAAVAGLVASGANLCLLPTADYDRWAARDAASRWREVADAWLDGGRHYSRSAEPGGHALGPEAEAPSAPLLRRLVLRLAVDAGLGTRPDLDRLTDAVAWRLPRAARGPVPLSTLVAWTWREAGWLGLTGLDAVSGYAAALLEENEPLPSRLLELFPAPVDQLIVQADLTAVAPGPLVHTLADDLRMLADQESRGGGGVYRFSAGSLRRAYEAGWSSTEIHGWLEQHSATGVPQPLAYLIDDMARQYGSVRVGSALSYLRVEDPAQVAALLAAPEARPLGLREVGGGVLLSSADASELVSFLREHGHAPAVEDEQGRTVSAPPHARAAVVRKDLLPSPPAPAEAVGALLAVEDRRRRQLAEVNGSSPEPVATTEQTLRELASAASAETRVHVRYVAADGQPAERALDPLDLGAGVVRAVDPASAQVLSIPLSRISSVRPVSDAT